MASDDANFGEFGDVLARLLLAVGRGLARAPTCNCTIQHLPGDFAPSHRALLVRALSLLGPTELPLLRGADSTVLKLALSILEDEEDAAADALQATEAGHAATSSSEACGLRSPTLSQALVSLRVVAWSPAENTRSRRMASADGSEKQIAFLIERYASTLEVLDCPVWPLDVDDPWERALATCARLESLAYARRFAPTAWLGLSQLHTLRGVDIHLVSIRTIAGALPLLHTLEVASEEPKTAAPAAAVAGFFECLLPRLRMFHFSGVWPKDDPAIAEPPRPLPLLHELHWRCKDFVSCFSNAQPVIVSAPFQTVIARWLPSCEATDCGRSSRGPLARVRHLRIFSCLLKPPEMASVLRAAPELRTLHAGVLFRGGLDWAADPAFDGLTHPRLRRIRVPGFGTQRDTDYDLLQQHHFPRLQELLFEKMTSDDVVFL
jgi:hypothetical protein